MAEYGKQGANREDEVQSGKRESESSTAKATTASASSDGAQKFKQGCVGCLGLLVLFGGCSALVGVLTPEKLTAKCERDLQSRHSIKGYSRKASLGFVTVSQGESIETVAFEFFYDGEKGPSIAEQEQRAPIYRGRAYCRIDKNTKEVKTTYERIARFSDGE